MSFRSRSDSEDYQLVSGGRAVRLTSARTIAPGDQLRTVPCLVCSEAIGPGPAITVAITYYTPAASVAGNLPATSWLIHARHRDTPRRELHDLAEWRLGTTPTRRTTPT